jgi:hypothetical protein
MRRPSYTRLLEARWACREVEGGCGAQPGERCKTFASGKPTQPHEDRWAQQRAHDAAEDQRRRRPSPPASPPERWARVLTAGHEAIPAGSAAPASAVVRLALAAMVEECRAIAKEEEQ